MRPNELELYVRLKDYNKLGKLYARYSQMITTHVGSLKLRRFLADIKMMRLGDRYDYRYLSNEMAALDKHPTVSLGPIDRGQQELLIANRVKEKAKYSQQSDTPDERPTMSDNFEPLSAAQIILYYIQRRGNQYVKTALKDTDDVLKFMRYETRFKTASDLRIVNPIGYCGPFQIGPLAWFDGQHNVTGYVITIPKPVMGKRNKSQVGWDRVMSATKNGERGGPADLDTATQVVVNYWNQASRYAMRILSKKGVHMSPSLLYLIHNQGGGGAVAQVLQVMQMHSERDKRKVLFGIGQQSLAQRELENNLIRELS